MTGHQADFAAFARFDHTIAIPLRQKAAASQEGPDLGARRIEIANKAHRAFGNDFALARWQNP